MLWYGFLKCYYGNIVQWCNCQSVHLTSCFAIVIIFYIQYAEDSVPGQKLKYRVVIDKLFKSCPTVWFFSLLDSINGISGANCQASYGLSSLSSQCLLLQLACCHDFHMHHIVEICSFYFILFL